MSYNQNIPNGGQQSNIPLTPILFAHWIDAPDNTKESSNHHVDFVKEKIILNSSTSHWNSGFSKN